MNTQNNLDDIRRALFFEKRGIYEVKDSEGHVIYLDGEKKEKPLKISKFDFKNFDDFTDYDLIGIIQSDLGVDIRKKEGIKRFNEIFFDSLGIYETSHIKRIFEKKGIKGPERYYPFNDDEEGKSTVKIIKFLREAGKDRGWKGKMHCFMVQVVSSINDALNTPGIDKREENEEIFFGRLSKVLSLEEYGDNYVGYIGVHKFKLLGRIKSLQSCISKELTDVDYNKLSEAKDGVGYTLKLKGGAEDYVRLLSHISNISIALGGDIKECKVKGINIDKYTDLLPEGIEVKSEKKGSSGNGYMDIKISLFFKGTGFEIKIVPEENKNHYGLNLQGIYKYLDKYAGGYFARNLNNGFITKENLDDLALEYFNEIGELIHENPEKRGEQTDTILEELWTDMQAKGYIDRDNVKFCNRRLELNIKTYLLPGLIKYWKSKLIEIELDNGDIAYTTKKGKLLSEKGFYANFQEVAEKD